MPVRDSRTGIVRTRVRTRSEGPGCSWDSVVGSAGVARRLVAWRSELMRDNENRADIEGSADMARKRSEAKATIYNPSTWWATTAAARKS